MYFAVSCLDVVDLIIVAENGQSTDLIHNGEPCK